MTEYFCAQYTPSGGVFEHGHSWPHERRNSTYGHVSRKIKQSESTPVSITGSAAQDLLEKNVSKEVL